MLRTRQQPTLRLAGLFPRMSRQTSISISFESDFPIAVTITSIFDSVHTVSFDRNLMLVFLKSLLFLKKMTISGPTENPAHGSRSRHKGREAFEKLAKARCAGGSNSFARSVRSVRSAISSERFEAPQVSTARLVQSVPNDPPALPAPTASEQQPELPTAQSSWLEWFAMHAPRRDGPHTSEEAQVLSDVGGDVLQNSEFTAFVGPYISVRNRVAELERAQTTSEHGSDQGKGVQRFLGERDWELQSARGRVQELEGMIKRHRSRTSFESVVSRDPQTPPGSRCDAAFPSDERHGPVA